MKKEKGSAAKARSKNWILFLMIGWLGLLSTFLVLERFGIFGASAGQTNPNPSSADLSSIIAEFRQSGTLPADAQLPATVRAPATADPAAAAAAAARVSTGGQIRNPTSALGSVLPFVSGQAQTTTQPIHLVYTVLNQPEDETIRLLGTLEAETVRVHAKVSSDIESIPVQEGDFVTRGDTLTVLNDLSFRIAYLRTLTDFELSADRSPRDREVIQMQLEQAEEDLRNVVVTSPVDGIITNIMRAEGERAAAGAQILSVVDLGNMFVSAAVDEMDFNKVYKGMPVIVTFQNYGTKIAGTVRSVSPMARTISGVVVVPITIQLQESPWDHGIIAGVTCDVDLIVRQFAQGYTVPAQALYTDAQGSYVIKKEMDRERMVYVTLGERSERLIEIVSGIHPGDVLIIREQGSSSEALVAEEPSSDIPRTDREMPVGTVPGTPGGQGGQGGRSSSQNAP